MVSPGSRNDDTCVVVAAYNEAAAIGEVLTSLGERFAQVVVVDDGSTDPTAVVAQRHGARVVRHPVNLGQGAALQTGLAYATAHLAPRWLVTFDADGQHHPSDAEAMLRAARQSEVQVVLGSRFLGHTDAGIGRRTMLRAAARFSALTTGLDITDAHNGLRVLRADVAAELELRLHGMSHASEVLSTIAASGWSWTEHPVTITYSDYSRAKGQRGYNALNIVFELACHRLSATS